MLSNFQSAYPTFERILKDGQQRLELLPNPREIDWALTKVKGQRQLVSFLTLFKCAQHLLQRGGLRAVAFLQVLEAALGQRRHVFGEHAE